MAVTNFVPELWGKKLLKDLDREHMLVRNCTSEYTGEITGKGSVVTISSLITPTVSDYDETVGLSNPEVLTDEARKLTITEAKSFNFQLGKISKTQAEDGNALMKEALRKATVEFKNVAERFIAGLYTEAGAVVTETALTSGNVLSTVLKGLQKLRENNVTDMNNVVLEIPPFMFFKLKLANILYTDDPNALKTAGIYSPELGIDVFVSNNLSVDVDGNTHALLRTKEAIAYAEQIMDVKKYEPESNFGEAIKGLHVYGAKPIKPKELVDIEVKFAEETTI